MSADLRYKVGQWLRIRVQHETALESRYGTTLDAYKRDALTKKQTIEQLFTQLSADADHSALLARLLDGKEPLPEPPPTSHAYPVYPDD